ncbi:MAG: hypothetical protein ACYDHE_19690 [Candidatus Acidiferrales bacterium]
MKRQEIVVVLELKEGQKPYEFLEHQGTYEAFKHFFEDIDYKVLSIASEVIES